MNLQEIKQIYETSSYEKVNQFLKRGWYLLMIYQPNSKNINYVLGTREKSNGATSVKIGLGIKVEID